MSTVVIMKNILFTKILQGDHIANANYAGPMSCQLTVRNRDFTERVDLASKVLDDQGFIHSDRSTTMMKANPAIIVKVCGVL